MDRRKFLYVGGAAVVAVPVSNAQQNSVPIDVVESPREVTQAVTSLQSYPQTAAEISAGVTPINYQYEPGNVLRYGGDVTASAATNDTAFTDALASNVKVIVPFVGTGRYQITAAVTLGLWGQQLIGDGTGNELGTAEGVTLDVVSGFPTSGGKASQSAIVVTDRYQSVQNLSIDCNSIALHGIYGTGGEVTGQHHKNIIIQAPTSDGVHFLDSTWMNRFNHIRVSNAGGYGFNWDASSGGATHTTLNLQNCYASSCVGGYRFDAVAGYVLNACAADSCTGYAVTAVAGGSGVVNGMDCEGTEQLFDLSDQTSVLQHLSVNGGRFLGFGDATPVARLIYNGGNLEMKGCLFQTNNGATAFLETRNGSITEIHGCTTPNGDMIDETNTIASSCYASIDYLRHLSNNTGAEERLLVRSGSTPRVHLSEIGAADDLVIEVAGAVGYLRGIDSTTFSTERTFLSVGLASTSIGFLGAAPVTRPTVTGSRGGNAALADLLTELEALGLITDSSS